MRLAMLVTILHVALPPVAPVAVATAMGGAPLLQVATTVQRPMLVASLPLVAAAVIATAGVAVTAVVTVATGGTVAGIAEGHQSHKQQQQEQEEEELEEGGEG